MLWRLFSMLLGMGASSGAAPRRGVLRISSITLTPKFKSDAIEVVPKFRTKSIDLKPS